MGMFDFLKTKLAPVAGGTMEAMGPAGELGQLTMAPTMQRQPGAFSRFMAPDANGITGWDRLMLAGAALKDINGDGEAMVRTHAMLKDTRDRAERDRKNAAFKGAYGPDGKFHLQKYIEAGGDATEGAAYDKALRPDMGVDDGVPWTRDAEGRVVWGEQRPISHAEELAIARMEETERRNRELEDIARGRLGVAEHNARTSDYRAHKAPAGGGGPSWLPPGSRIVHLPGQ